MKKASFLLPAVALLCVGCGGSNTAVSSVYSANTPSSLAGTYNISITQGSPATGELTAAGTVTVTAAATGSTDDDTITGTVVSTYTHQQYTVTGTITAIDNNPNTISVTFTAPSTSATTIITESGILSQSSSTSFAGGLNHTQDTGQDSLTFSKASS